MPLKIMLQGTGSSVGKSLLVTALCRIFKQDGYTVAPFKSQNMALNSFITEEGLEMGRAQVAQAEAAGLKPTVLMNPVLLKPSSDKNCQVILRGKVYENMSAQEYQKFKPELLSMIKEDFYKLSEGRDIIVIEGAGSPAEINLRDRDIVNMGMAELVNAPVLLVGDIDKGGVFASIAGTLLLLNDDEKKRIEGVIINKFRGDIEVLNPGITMLEDIIHKKVLGVVPHMDVIINEEDGATDRFYRCGKNGSIDIAVINLPHTSNFTDFEPLEKIPDVRLRYINKGEKIGKCDVLIIPGSKNTIGDLKTLKSNGFVEEIFKLRRQGSFIVGICGGYQMLGRTILDPHMIEGPISETDGIGLLDMQTVIEDKKTTTQVKANISNELPEILRPLKGLPISGYEIHMGKTVVKDKPLCHMTDRNGKKVDIDDGCVSEDGKVFGTYIHGIFENSDFTKAFINMIRKYKGLSQIDYVEDYRQFKEREYDRLADIVRRSIDLKRIYEIMEGYRD
ncbi:cobyric acid synthase [Thermoanaerobacterium sp. RBIITD]|uniref:cobyric acid synthase n=1 Tax=Thermoanaerobacterium sp. RBIITD TaxID=1550240 RepID=UPI000BB740D9|nr:cobyric acid synthase [Thermoanaerobacterium sp. RBIITD]SNX53224.1 adenosylcobyric acid synthase (glutamine-hydrolysing) [Thermoanaerobacterium sp. RBIITD]